MNLFLLPANFVGLLFMILGYGFILLARGCLFAGAWCWNVPVLAEKE